MNGFVRRISKTDYNKKIEVILQRGLVNSAINRPACEALMRAYEAKYVCQELRK